LSVSSFHHPQPGTPSSQAANTRRARAINTINKINTVKDSLNYDFAVAVGEQRTGENVTVPELTGMAPNNETPARACKRKADVMDAMNKVENGHKAKVAKRAMGKLFLPVYPQ